MSELRSLANRMVPMVTACRLAGLSVPDSSRKTACPDDLLHPDQGRDPAFRVYAHDAWCFACSQFWTPVKVYAQLKEVTEEQAATVLLAAIGHKPAAYAHLWLVAARPPEPNRGALATALKTYCGGIDPEWLRDQFRPGVAEYLAACLEFLQQVTDEASARIWLEQSKAVMQTVLGRMGHAHYPV